MRLTAVVAVAALAGACQSVRSTRPGKFARPFDRQASEFTVDSRGITWPTARKAHYAPIPVIQPPVHRCRGAIGKDPTSITEAETSGDFLRLQVRWGGGCGEHHVDLCYRTLPRGPDDVVRLELTHKSHDGCEAVVAEDLIFPLRPLRDEVGNRHGGSGRGITLLIEAVPAWSSPEKAAVVAYRF